MTDRQLKQNSLSCKLQSDSWGTFVDQKMDDEYLAYCWQGWHLVELLWELKRSLVLQSTPFFFFRIFHNIYQNSFPFCKQKKKDKQTNKRKQKKKVLSFWILSLPWRCCLIRKCKCASTYLEELSIQFSCHKNTWKIEELYLEELFSRYPPVLRIQFFLCYLRQQRPTTWSFKCIINEEIMQFTCSSDRVCFHFIFLNVLLQMQRCLFCIFCFLRESSLCTYLLSRCGSSITFESSAWLQVLQTLSCGS